MESFLTGLLTISIVGLVFLLAFKRMEVLTGKRVFLPVRVYEKDKEIEEKAKRMGRTAAVAGKRAVNNGWRITCNSCNNLWQHIMHMRKRSVRQPLEKNGSGSVYLKQMMEHKENIRNGDH